jgi:hypothetical protein
LAFDELGQSASRQQRLARIDKLATLLDSALWCQAPISDLGWMRRRAVPGIGDLVTSLVSLYIVHEARRWRADASARSHGREYRHRRHRYLAPIAGDIFDVMWRANRRNMTLLYDHLRSQGEFARPVSGTEF